MTLPKPLGHHLHPPASWRDIFERLSAGECVEIPKHKRYTLLQTRDIFLRQAAARGVKVDVMVALGHMDAWISEPPKT